MPIKESQLPSDAPITVTVSGPLARKIRHHHAISQIGTSFGGKTYVEKFVIEIIEGFITDCRSGKLPPANYLERNRSDADHARI